MNSRDAREMLEDLGLEVEDESREYDSPILRYAQVIEQAEKTINKFKRRADKSRRENHIAVCAVNLPFEIVSDTCGFLQEKVCNNETYRKMSKAFSVVYGIFTDQIFPPGGCSGR